MKDAAFMNINQTVSVSGYGFYFRRKIMKEKEQGRFTKLNIAFLILLPIACSVFALAAGRFYVPISYAAGSVLSRLGFSFSASRQLETVLWSVRLPRIILALLSGAGLSVAGCVFQGLFSNPLAAPDTLGVASGASFGAACALLLGAGLIEVQISAMLFGIMAVALTWLSSYRKSSEDGKSMPVLAGIMIGSLFSSLVSLVKFAADTESELPAITYWLMGSLSSASYKNLLLGAPAIISGIVILFLLRWRLNLLPLSDDEAKSSGVNISALKGITVVCASAITASCVAMCGQVGWVGLLVPHICRMKFGNNHTLLIPASVSIGGSFMVVVDTLSRTVSAAELPVSVLTAVIGAPFFITLMRRTGGWSL